MSQKSFKDIIRDLFSTYFSIFDNRSVFAKDGCLGGYQVLEDVPNNYALISISDIDEVEHSLILHCINIDNYDRCDIVAKYTNSCDIELSLKSSNLFIEIN